MSTKIKKKSKSRPLTTLEKKFSIVLNTHTERINVLMARVECLEVYLLKNNPEVTPDSLALMIGDTMDRHTGLVKVERPVALEDTVRLRFRAVVKGEETPRRQQKTTVSKVGSGTSLPLEVENALLGMEVGDSKMLDYTHHHEDTGVETQHTAELTVDAISCFPAPAHEHAS